MLFQSDNTDIGYLTPCIDTGRTAIHGYALLSDCLKTVWTSIRYQCHFVITAFEDRDLMTILSVTDASRMAGVSRQTMYEKIKGEETNPGHPQIQMTYVFESIGSGIVNL